eukprot:2644684-Prymnesium_polylepis.1
MGCFGATTGRWRTTEVASSSGLEASAGLRRDVGGANECGAFEAVAPHKVDAQHRTVWLTTFLPQRQPGVWAEHHSCTDPFREVRRARRMPLTLLLLSLSARADVCSGGDPKMLKKLRQWIRWTKSIEPVCPAAARWRAAVGAQASAIHLSHTPHSMPAASRRV